MYSFLDTKSKGKSKKNISFFGGSIFWSKLSKKGYSLKKDTPKNMDTLKNKNIGERVNKKREDTNPQHPLSQLFVGGFHP